MMLLWMACHVFDSVEIPCTAGMRCAGEDSKPPTDTDTGTPVGPSPSVGVALSLTRGAASEVRVYDATGTQAKVWSGLALSGIGPLVYDPATAVAYVGTATGYARLDAGTTSVTADIPGPFVDLGLMGTSLLLASPTEIALVAPATGIASLRSTAPYENLVTVATGADVAYAVDLQRSGPDLVKVTSAGFSVQNADFDDNDNRATALFLGDAGLRLVCSARGIVYGVDDLAAGVTTPMAVCDADLTDTADCAFDPATDELLLFSPTRGVWAMPASGVGTCEERLAPPDGFTLIGSYFYR